MTAHSQKKDCCKEEKVTLVKATDLPRHGNPNPPKDVILNERPNFLESKIGSMRSSIQPLTQPIGLVYERVSDFAATGVAHSSSAMQRLSESQNPMTNALIIAGASLVGYVLGRRRKLLTGIVFGSGATAACYPKDAEEKAQVMWYIAKNKLPEVAKQQYDKLFKGNSDPTKQTQSTETKS